MQWDQQQKMLDGRMWSVCNAGPQVCLQDDGLELSLRTYNSPDTSRRHLKTHYCDLNPGPSAPETSTLTTRLPSHPVSGGRGQISWIHGVTRSISVRRSFAPCR